MAKKWHVIGLKRGAKTIYERYHERRQALTLTEKNQVLNLCANGDRMIGDRTLCADLVTGLNDIDRVMELIVSFPPFQVNKQF